MLTASEQATIRAVLVTANPTLTAEGATPSAVRVGVGQMPFMRISKDFVTGSFIVNSLFFVGHFPSLHALLRYLSAALATDPARAAYALDTYCPEEG